MKALSIATLFALGAVGTACSQATETTAEAQPTDIVTVDNGDDAGGSFNLELPNDIDAASGTPAWRRGGGQAHCS